MSNYNVQGLLNRKSQVMMRKRKMSNMLENDQKKHAKLPQKKNISFFTKFLFKKKAITFLLLWMETGME